MIFKNAQDLWPALITEAGLDVPTRWNWVLDLLGMKARDRKNWYDAELMDELRQQLFPGTDGAFEDLLMQAAPPLSAEALIRAFFRLLQPFSLMKTDILEMLSAAGAQSSDDNIRIRFQFDPSGDPLELLLNEFREQMETIDRCVRTVAHHAWTVGKTWGLQNVPRDDPNWPDERHVEATPSDGEIGVWLTRYWETHEFGAFPDSWRTGHGQLDHRLERVVGMLEELLSAYRRYGNNYADLQAARDRSSAPPTGESYQTKHPAELSVGELASIESDFLGAYIGEWVMKARRVALTHGGDSPSVAQIISEIDEHLPVTGEKEIAENVQRLLDVLKLPVWKQREQVYAVWIGTQIWNALKHDWTIQFHVRDSVLSFAFKGVHLASLQRPDQSETLAWWTELETDATGLPSGKRSRGIKPDYRIRIPPFDAPDADVVVVEVKQYMRGGRANFKAALIDYTSACERAPVLLANYGPVSRSLLDDIPQPSRSRALLFGHVRPDRKENCLELQQAIDALVDLGARRGSFAPVASKRIGRIELHWGDRPGDLDLHLFGLAAGGETPVHVYYRQPMSESDIRYGGDARDGWGPESISLGSAKGRFRVCVHNFSGDGELADSNAVVDVFSDEAAPGKIATFDCPTSGAGVWWIVCEIDCDSGNIRGIGKLASQA